MMDLPMPSSPGPVLRLQFMSDLHIEFAQALELLPKWTAQAPILALLGDIGKVSQEKYLHFIESQSKIFKQVLVLFGNHEYYHCETCDTLVAETREKFKHLTNVTLMQKTGMEINGVMVLGTTLWSHVPADDVGAVSRVLNDYSVIRTGIGADRRRITPNDTNRWHKEERAWLEAEIAKAKAKQQPVLILTHHAPLSRGTSAPKFDGNQINVAFSTPLEALMGAPVKAWLYGHTHYNNSQVKNGTLITCNQVGYSMVPGERVGFDPHKVLEVTATGAQVLVPPPTEAAPSPPVSAPTP